ncbi:helix-turn-helix domain-containing protein [Paenibacillus sp. FSL H8-0283]|uniref:helix-turn-helix domain-containing protein n=1 Tax=Paenibacillus sp. FSL H8-0283 TaxID=2921383 RepID=UPI003864872A
MSEFSIAVGNRIRALRKQRGWTQEQLAEKANLHYSYLSSLERGGRNMSLESLGKIIEAFEINPIQILNFADTLLLDEEANKQETIKAIRNQLELCNEAEVKMVYRMLNDIIQTFKKDDYKHIVK